MRVTNSLVCWGLETFANDEQCEKYLRPLTNGSTFGAFLLSEPEAGSDATSQRTTAEDALRLERDHGGDRVRVRVAQRGKFKPILGVLRH